MPDCIFCKIINGDIPSSKIYEDEHVVSFLDIAPANKGHGLVLPKEHYETYVDLPDETVQHLTKAVKMITKAIVQSTGCAGYNLLMNNYKVAGQVVPHSHIHIIPRFENDGLSFNWEPKKYEENEMNGVVDKIKNSL